LIHPVTSNQSGQSGGGVRRNEGAEPTNVTTAFWFTMAHEAFHILVNSADKMIVNGIEIASLKID
jgi:hypothetical protein